MEVREGGEEEGILEVLLKVLVHQVKEWGYW